jgi:hypothetical protein
LHAQADGNFIDDRLHFARFPGSRPCQRYCNGLTPKAPTHSGHGGAYTKRN